MDFLQINKFSELHDGSKIIFCKTDFIAQEFENIKNIKNDVTLITGNSDYAITDNIVAKAPKNIKRWFAQNAISNSGILIPLPLGLENKTESLRSGHGIGYLERVKEKERLLSRHSNENPTKKIYANFNIATNFGYRNALKNFIKNSTIIDWEESNLSLENFFDKILDYEMTLCPIGNGVDTHRLWEVLYSNRIPITIKVGDFKIYELYEDLPIIILQNLEELNDLNLIQKHYDVAKQKIWDKEMLNYKWWKNKILNEY